MGARQYLPAVGRFLQVDPVEGGSANDYDYVDADPVNHLDLDGSCVLGKFGRNCKHGLTLRGTLRGVAFAATIVALAATPGGVVLEGAVLTSFMASGMALTVAASTHHCRSDREGGECVGDAINVIGGALGIRYASRFALFGSRAFSLIYSGLSQTTTLRQSAPVYGRARYS